MLPAWATGVWRSFLASHHMPRNNSIVFPMGVMASVGAWLDPIVGQRRFQKDENFTFRRL